MSDAMHFVAQMRFTLGVLVGFGVGFVWGGMWMAHNWRKPVSRLICNCPKRGGR